MFGTMSEKRSGKAKGGQKQINFGLEPKQFAALLAYFDTIKGDYEDATKVSHNHAAKKIVVRFLRENGFLKGKAEG